MHLLIEDGRHIENPINFLIRKLSMEPKYQKLNVIKGTQLVAHGTCTVQVFATIIDD